LEFLRQIALAAMMYSWTMDRNSSTPDLSQQSFPSWCGDVCKPSAGKSCWRI